MKYLFFRVDSSYTIASGHLVRCQRLANIFSNKYKVIFLINKFEGNFNFLLKNFNKVYLDYKNERFINSKNDCKKTIEILKKYNGKKILIVDHYSLNYTWQKKVRKYVDRLVCINDYLKKNYFDYLINETYYPKKISQICLKKKTKILSGPRYAMIDNLKNKKSTKNGIFVFFGSVDEKNITFRLIQILKKITNKKIYIVIGKKNKNKHKILNIKEKRFIKIYKYVNLNFYLSKSDTAIIAGGSIIWEALFNKVRTIVISTAKNQYSNVKNLEKDKLVETLSLNKLNENVIKKLIFKKNNKITKNIVDGYGIKRIYNELINVI